MFIIQNGKITSEKTLDIGKLRVINLVFKSDLQFADDDKFKLVLGSIQSENYAFVDGGCFRFSYVNVAEIIKKENTDLSIKVTCNGSQIVSDSITITAYVQGGGSGEEIQGIVFNAPLKIATEVKIIPQDLTKDFTDFSSMFFNCSSLTSIPLLYTSNGKNFAEMFRYNSKLVNVPPFDTTNATNINLMFGNCSSLVTLSAFNVPNLTSKPNYPLQSCGNLENFGGFIGIKVSFDIAGSKKLTHQSLLNVLNGLYDLTGSSSQTLTIGSTNLAKLTDQEKAIATNKNWVLA